MVSDQQQQAIQQAAYDKWECAGKTSGDDLKFWFEAEREYLNQRQTPPPDVVHEATEESPPASDPPASSVTLVRVRGQKKL